MAELELWHWRYTDQWGKRRTTRYLLTEEDARTSLRDPEKVEGSLEIRPHWDTLAIGKSGPEALPGVR